MRYRKALCIYPYVREVPIYGFFPPLGLEYIAGAIEDLVPEITIIDLRHEKRVTETLNNGADILCVSVNWDYEFEAVCSLIRSLPKDVMTVVGGRHATANVEEIFALCPNVDVVVRGDGEETIRELVQSGSPERVAGLSYRHNGRVIHNENRSLAPVSDTLLPNRKIRRYTYRISYEKVNLGYEFDSLMSSRGCPYNCRFCSFKLNPLGQKRNWSARSPESVVNELRGIKAKVVAFLDDEFFVDPQRAEDICDGILREKIKKKYIVNARISIASHPRLLKKMHAAGFRLLMIGIESAQDRSLRQLNKGFTTDEVRKAFRTLRKSKMLTSGYFIIGLIGETDREMLEIAPFAKEIGVDVIHLNRLRYQKFSGLAGLLEKNPDYYIGEHQRIYSKAYGPKEINGILKQIRGDFFSPPRIFRLVLKGIWIGFPNWLRILRLTYALPRIIHRLRKRRKLKRARRTKAPSGPNGSPTDMGEDGVSERSRSVAPVTK